jgi:hypothetical protein
MKSLLLFTILSGYSGFSTGAAALDLNKKLIRTAG